ncbi:DUF839 domain-containing protein [Sporolactobacillus sp. THM7-7]|nr:DUF839 domain-containing protein [Sporolactobacillus sp. THM7-7]
MNMKKIAAPLLGLALLVPAVSSVHAQSHRPAYDKEIEFIGMDAPKTAAEQNTMYSKALVKVKDENGEEKTVPLSYNLLFKPGDVINGKTTGTTVNSEGRVIMDTVTDPDHPKPYVSTAPDSNTLLSVNGKSGKLYLVNHFESIPSNIGRLPNAIYLNTVKQDKKTGKLAVTDIKPIDFSQDGGIWTPCAGILSPWNTHLGAEEYEPDARAHEKSPETSAVTQFARHYYNDDKRIGNPYLYGHLPEISVSSNGKATAAKHYSMGRLSFERTTVMPDNRTVYIGDDGTYTMMFMYIADRAKDLSAGTLYAAKWHQTGSAEGGASNLNWIRLGHATDKEVKKMAQSLTFSDIFETTEDKAYAEARGFAAVKTSSSGGKTEYLKVKPGMKKAAAFLESRRYGAILGATSEFNKMEAVEYNKKDNKVYMAMSYIEKGMGASASDPADDIHVDKISAGGVYEIGLSGGQRDAEGKKMESDFIATSMNGLITGEDLDSADSAGNTADVDKIANPDNIVYSDKMRTLFIAEDSSMHSNNFAWAYNIDTKKLSRLVSVPDGGEATGLQFQENLNGHTYLMVSSQNPGSVGYLQLPNLYNKNKKNR